MYELRDYAPILGSGLSAIYFLFFYPLATFRYRIAEGAIEMEWIVLGFIRISRKRFDLERVESAGTTTFLRCLWPGRGFHVFGNIFARQGVALTLKQGVLWTTFGRIVYVTPRDRERFMGELRAALQRTSDAAPGRAATPG